MHFADEFMFYIYIFRKQLFFMDFQSMTSIKEHLLAKVAESATSPVNKVTVVGVGQVGMACAFSILAQVSVAIDAFRDAILMDFFRCPIECIQ